MIINERLRERVKVEEGLSLKLYRCTAGKTTIGYGHNVQDNGISIAVANFMLDDDIKNTMTELLRHYPAYEFFPSEKQEALFDMLFNMGIAKFSGFKRMHKALAVGDFETAADEILDSKYHNFDVPGRSKRNADIIRS